MDWSRGGTQSSQEKFYIAALLLAIVIFPQQLIFLLLQATGSAVSVSLAFRVEQVDIELRLFLISLGKKDCD